MPVFRPRIGKIKIDLFNCSLLKYVRQLPGIFAEKEKVRQLQYLLLLNGFQKHRRVTLNAYIVDIRISLSQFHKKLAFSHSHFYVNRVSVAKHSNPIRPSFYGILNHIGTFCYLLFRAWNMAQSHNPF